MRPISSLPRCSPRERVWLTINYDSLHQGHVKEPAGNAVEPDGIFRIHRRQQAEGRVSTASSLHARAGRWLVIAVSGAGMLAAAATLVLIWMADTPLPTRINESMVLGSALLLLGVAFLVAWRAGDHPPNVSMALALAFINGNAAFIVLLGLVYFYVMYRSGDVETRRKVLWFFEAALATLVIGLVAEGVNVVLHGTGSPTLRVVLSVSINSATCLAQVICISAAVFYAGAISPALVIRKTFIYGTTAALLLFTYATVEAFLVNIFVDVAGISDLFARSLLGTLFGLTFHPIKNRMEHALRRFGSLARRRIV